MGAPGALDQIVAKLTAYRRDDRYPSSRLAAARLGSLLSGAAPLPNGERGVRARAALLMYNLYPAEPGRSRSSFARLVAAARTKDEAPAAGASASIAAPAAVERGAEDDGQSDMLAGTRYRLVREIGRGASSVVYEAEHVELGRRVALKVLDARHTDSREFALRFRREARALSRLACSGLVRVFDFGQAADGRLFCVMELCAGRTLRASLDRGERFDWVRALRIVRQACLALHFAHDKGVVHRDIKPANLFLTASGGVKVIDFGLAKTAGEVGEPAAPPSGADGGDTGARPRRDGQHAPLELFGTPEYMAPEQAAGGRVDGRADLYSLGCVLYELLTGRLPFRAVGAVGILDAKLKGRPEPTRRGPADRAIPRAAERIAGRALARHPSRRYQSAFEMAEAIADALDEPTRQRARRRFAAASLLAAACAGAAVAVGIQAGPLLGRLPLPPPPPAAVPASPHSDPGARRARATGAPDEPPAGPEAPPPRLHAKPPEREAPQPRPEPRLPPAPTDHGARPAEVAEPPAAVRTGAAVRQMPEVVVAADLREP
ncbi:MAG: serine/threonine protein kinase [Deltaproteobacteria bacterium]|nr:serine/threonine protein kinase [Deltaproteobacteria bacterium]